MAFFNASIGSFSGLVDDTKRKGSGSDSSSLESSLGTSDDSTRSDSQGSSTITSARKDAIPESTTIYEILGFSTSGASSINNKSRGRLTLREVFLKALLRRYLNSKIFNYSEEGSLSLDESSDRP